MPDSSPGSFPTAPPAVIVLAAGRGSRFTGDGHKLLQPFGATDGTVLEHSIANAVSTGLPVVLVTLSRLCDDRTPLGVETRVTLPEEGETGIGVSIAAGVRAARTAGGWLILPGDMPLVRPETIVRVAAALHSGGTARALHRGLPGHPVAFARKHYRHLVGLREDVGARDLLASHPPQLIETEDAGTTLDIDTVADLDRLRNLDLTPPGFTLTECMMQDLRHRSS